MSLPQSKCCRSCGVERWGREPGGWDFAGAYRQLCAACWSAWLNSREYREAAASPCPDVASLERWLASAGSSFVGVAP